MTKSVTVESESTASPLVAAPSVRSRSSSACIALLMGVFTAAVGIGLDWMLVRDQFPKMLTMDISDAIAAAVVGLLFYRILEHKRERQMAVYRRLQTIAEMNHHIRNALQVIAYSTDSPDRDKEMENVRTAVQRITWALNEILPKL